MLDAAFATDQPSGSEDDLVRAHLPLVYYAVAETAARVPRHVGRDDLVSAGMAGLAQAARNFDPARGIPFGRFASTRIRGALIDELRSRDWASRSVRAKARAVAATTDRLSAQLCRTPTNREVAQAMGTGVAAIEAIAADVHRAVVLDLDALPIEGRPNNAILAASGTPDDVLLAEEQRRTMLAAVASLPDRLRRVVVGSFFEDLSLQALANELGVTDSRISQMRTEALALLKDGINSQLDPELVQDGPRTGRTARRKQCYYQAIAEHPSVRARGVVGTPRLLSVA